jgi:sigma-B regulation protein RsbU (phosphoserine phosphatase)
LLANAIAYGDAKRPVRLEIVGGTDSVTLAVHNDGKPIPASLLPVLFEPFTRGTHDTISPQGLGLGLFVVNEIVKAQGGSIHVDSTAAAGTTFTIRLPRD